MLTVKARPGVTVPMEHDPRRHIAGEPVRVPESAYYRRRLKEGDLVIVASEAKESANGKS